MVVYILDRKMNVRVTYDGANAVDWQHFAFYRQPGLLAESSPCHAFPIATCLSDTTASDTSWENLRRWLDACEKHTACKRGGVSPKRVIDVGVGEVGGISYTPILGFTKAKTGS